MRNILIWENKWWLSNDYLFSLSPFKRLIQFELWFSFIIITLSLLKENVHFFLVAVLLMAKPLNVFDYIFYIFYRSCLDSMNIQCIALLRHGLPHLPRHWRLLADQKHPKLSAHWYISKWRQWSILQRSLHFLYMQHAF